MINGYVVIFLLLGSIFAFVHQIAVTASLYWYYWWFDIVMHFWGGLLIGLGVHAICTFSFIHLRPTFSLLLIMLVLATSAWEIFEWSAGLWNADTYVFDTTKDVILGFSGGLLAHLVLSRYTIKQ